MSDKESKLKGDADFMALALKQAREALAEGEIPVGACVVKDDAVIFCAHNSTRASKSAMAHAETLALEGAMRVLGESRLDGCTLYVTLEPCPMCVGAALVSRVKRIVFGAYEPQSGACRSKADLTRCGIHHIEAYGGVSEAESASLLTDFFEARRFHCGQDAAQASQRG